MRKYNRSLQKALSISSTILGSLGLLGGTGYFLSKKFNNDLWLLLIIVGAIVGLYELYKQINKWFLYLI